MFIHIGIIFVHCWCGLSIIIKTPTSVAYFDLTAISQLLLSLGMQYPMVRHFKRLLTLPLYTLEKEWLFVDSIIYGVLNIERIEHL